MTNLDNIFTPKMSTPWGKINHYHKIDDGIYSVSTPGHGGIWLSDEHIEKLPKRYKSFTGTNRFHEEDEDAPLVLQYLGYLSLIKEPLTLDITEVDIFRGYGSRESFCNFPHYGGPIVEAYKRVTGNPYNYDQMICRTNHLCPKPGGYRLAELCDTALDFMIRFDAKEEIQPTTITLTPYTVRDRVEVIFKRSNGYKFAKQVNQRVIENAIEGKKENIEFLFLIYGDKTVTKAEYNGETIYRHP